MRTIEITRIKFLWPGRMYEFKNSNNLPLKRGDKVVVENPEGGNLIGTVSIAPRLRAYHPDDQHLTAVLRVATDQDLQVEKVQDEFRRDVKNFFDSRLAAREFGGTRLVEIEKLDGGRRLVVYFANESKKFPVKDLALELGHRFGMRVDMRPVGVRDAARLAGGIGKCGLSLCCATWLPDFSQVTIRMAKDQGLSLEPDGISGQCGRLLCCLGYEHENYLAMGVGMPKVGKAVITPMGDARVIKLDILKGTVTVRNEEGIFETYSKDQVKRKFPAGGGGHKDDDDDHASDPEGGT
jgi:cell fate regulator YaaT (PSP1 superfamily)